MTPLEKSRTQDYYNSCDEKFEKEIEERRRKFMRDRENGYFYSFINYIKSFFF